MPQLIDWPSTNLINVSEDPVWHWVCLSVGKYNIWIPRIGVARSLSRFLTNISEFVFLSKSQEIFMHFIKIIKWIVSPRSFWPSLSCVSYFLNLWENDKTRGSAIVSAIIEPSLNTHFTQLPRLTMEMQRLVSGVWCLSQAWSRIHHHLKLWRPFLLMSSFESKNINTFCKYPWYKM